MDIQMKPTYGERLDCRVTVEKLSENADPPTVQTKDRIGDTVILTATEQSLDKLHGIEEGEEYSIEDLMVYIPSEDPRRLHSILEEITVDMECYSCGGDIVFEPHSRETLDGLYERFGDEDRAYHVVTEETSVRRIERGDDAEYDDWNPMHNDRQFRDRPQNTAGEIRCEDCGVRATVDADRAVSELEQMREENDFGALTGHEAEEAFENVVDIESSGTYNACQMSTDEVGMATGGAKDATNFRENIAEGYTPQKDSLSYEGLFYDYYFDTGDRTETGDDDSLFYPTYSTAVSEDPVTDEKEKYLTVGLNSNLSKDEFERKPLNLVVALDVSGSMGSQFRDYYYDETGERREKEDTNDSTKMEAARESLAQLTHHLDGRDNFGVVLYNYQEHVAKPLNPVEETDMDSIRRHIREVEAGGGTNMQAGFEKSLEMIREEADLDSPDIENRIVFMTDAMPNTGATREDDLVDMIQDAAEDDVYTTFVGMGIDANEDLVDSLSSVRGANHYFVHSASEFEQRMDDEFEYMVTPLVFDLSLRVESSEYEISDVYGSPNSEEDAVDGEIMEVATLFPSPKEEGGTRGGVILLKLESTSGSDESSGSGKVGLEASWVERDGTRGNTVEQVTVPEEYGFDNTGIRKAVLLARYGRNMRDWIEAVRNGRENPEGEDDWNPQDRDRSQWEQGSVPLRLPSSYEETFEDLLEYLQAEKVSLGDEELENEIEVLDGILQAQ